MQIATAWGLLDAGILIYTTYFTITVHFTPPLLLTITELDSLTLIFKTDFYNVVCL